MKRLMTLLLMCLIGITASAQSAEKLYNDGKELYDAKRYEAAFPKLKAAAEKGHKKAQYRLGRCYDKGNGVEESNTLAFEWYLKSADQGYAKAQYQVGKSYKNGEGVDKDIDKAVEYFAKAAKQDNGDAQLALGKCYLKGKGVEKDEAKAKDWFKRAVKNEKDGKTIVKELRQEASEGDEDAILILQMLGIKL